MKALVGILAAAAEVQSFCQEQGWRSCVIGGLAVQRWGSPRFSGVSLFTSSAEDLVVHKCFAGRDRDWADVETALVRQHGKLDLALVRSELAPLLELKGDSESLAKLERMLTLVDMRRSAPH